MCRLVQTGYGKVGEVGEVDRQAGSHTVVVLILPGIDSMYEHHYCYFFVEGIINGIVIEQSLVRHKDPTYLPTYVYLVSTAVRK